MPMAEITGTTMKPLHKQNNLEIDISPVEHDDEMNGRGDAQSSPNTPNIKNKCSCPPWLYDLMCTSYTATGGVLVWIALIFLAYRMMSKLHKEDGDGTDRRHNSI
jgi:hypothetical protein